MDDADRAQESQELFRAKVLGKLAQHAPQRQDGQDCLACGDPIEPARRTAVPGVCTCITCQTRLERVRR